MIGNIGIIGGADGPTVTLVTSSPEAGWLLGGLILLLAVGIFLVIRLRKKK